MPKPDVILGEQSRVGMLRGFESMARLLAITLGPIGGNIANQICNFKDLFNEKKLEEPPYDEWETAVVVYDRDDCSNPNQTITIVGFATAIIREVTCPPDEKLIQAEVICENVDWGRGGGGNYGTMGSIPGLVE